jgi:transposase InsO family protein
MIQRHENRLLKSQEFIEKAVRLRSKHPELGCRKMALKLQDGSFGRDKLEGLLLRSGFRVIYPANFIKTTRSVVKHNFPNLVEGLLIKGINKVVQTDITYFWMNGRFGYLVFIIDVYSKLIVGYNAGFSMEAAENISALKMMIKLRGRENLKGLIHHSDRGSQYHCTEYIKLLKDHDIKISMCKEAWENAYAERINRTIKNEYLRHRQINTLQKLKKQLAIDVEAYNTDRPHRNLLRQMTPAMFEEYLSSIKQTKRSKMKIYKAENQNETMSFFSAIQQSNNKNSSQ